MERDKARLQARERLLFFTHFTHTVYLKSDGKSHPDALSLSFEIAGTNKIGCCLCEKEIVAGRGGWGFKSHCVRNHAHMCSFSDVERHNPSLLKALETASLYAVSSAFSRDGL